MRIWRAGPKLEKTSKLATSVRDVIQGTNKVNPYLICLMECSSAEKRARAQCEAD